MTLIHLLIFLTTLICCIEAKPNPCCPNDLPYIRGKGCMNNETSWIKANCGKAYSVNLKNVELNEDDTLSISDVTVITRDKFCVGSVDNVSIILVCFPGENQSAGSLVVIVSCIGVSILSLILTLAVYIILPRLRDLQGKCIMCTIISLLFGFIFLILVKNPRYSYNFCYFLAMGIYFWFLSAFFWMNVVAFHIWRSIVNASFPENSNRLFKIYNAYAWGGPIIISIIANIIYHIPGNHLKPTWAKHTCWFSDFHSEIVFFRIPVLILLSANVVFFICSAIALRKNTNISSNNKLRSRKYKFLLYLKLFLTMGICWIFEPISMFLQYDYLSNVWLIVDLINCLQGLIIFLLLVVFRKRVRRDLARHKGICCRKLPEDWATIPDEDCEELSEEREKLTVENEDNEIN